MFFHLFFFPPPQNLYSCRHEAPPPWCLPFLRRGRTHNERKREREGETDYVFLVCFASLIFLHIKPNRVFVSSGDGNPVMWFSNCGVSAGGWGWRLIGLANKKGSEGGKRNASRWEGNRGTKTRPQPRKKKRPLRARVSRTEVGVPGGKKGIRNRKKKKKTKRNLANKQGALPATAQRPEKRGPNERKTSA